ncbi:MAG: thioredoxin domain-containing protein [Desulfobacterales bacterium]|nr:thioredoxin domain-containing protein [Desulfobacterales bacterium]
MKYKIFALTCLALVAVFAATAFYYKGQKAQMYNFVANNDEAVFVRPHSPVLGNPDARVTIVEFMDPACETCAQFAPMVKGWMGQAQGKIKLVIRYAPFHKGADYFVKILEASRKQGMYWETLALLFENQRAWTRGHVAQPEKVWPLLSRLDLDLDRLRKDMESPAIAKRIEQDLADAKTLEVRKTPGFFVNGRPLEPFGSKNLYRLIQSEIRDKY